MTNVAKLRSEKVFRLLIVESVVTLAHCPPAVYYDFLWVQPDVVSTVSIGDLLVAVMCLRAYQLVYMLYWRNRDARELLYL